MCEGGAMQETLPAKGGIFSILSENQTLSTVPESAERYYKFRRNNRIEWKILPYYKIMFTFLLDVSLPPPFGVTKLVDICVACFQSGFFNHEYPPATERESSSFE